jgi:hypothetical protein
MRDDQRIRLAGILCTTLGYAARLHVVGNGSIPFFGYNISPFGLWILAIVVITLPEVIEMLPFGPSRKG